MRTVRTYVLNLLVSFLIERRHDPKCVQYVVVRTYCTIGIGVGISYWRTVRTTTVPGTCEASYRTVWYGGDIIGTVPYHPSTVPYGIARALLDKMFHSKILKKSHPSHSRQFPS